MKITIKVAGMSCGGCKLNLETAVMRLPGIISAEASLKNAELDVEFEESKTSPAAIRAAIAKAGFIPGDN